MLFWQRQQGTHFQSADAYRARGQPSTPLDNAKDCTGCRSLAKDGVNRSFAAVYDGQHSPEAAKDAAERLHLILQREDAVVAKNSGRTLRQMPDAMHIITLCSGTVCGSA